MSDSNRQHDSDIELRALPKTIRFMMPTPPSSRSLITTISHLASRTYILDWIGVILLQGSAYLLRFVISPVHQQFIVSDLRISHPFANPERVTSWENFIYCGIIPTGILVLWSLVFRSGFHKAHVTLLGMAVSITLAGFLTHVIKNAIGRPRPDLIARCIVDLGTPADILVGIEVCTNSDKGKLNDGWRSFPSGHSSFAFSGLGYFALFLAGQLHTFRSRVDLPRVLVTFAPLIGAMLVAMSRMADYRHDKYDVSVGSIIGMGIAYFAYKRYFKPLGSAKCHDVWPSPVDDPASIRSSPIRLQKNDEEEQRVRDAHNFDLEDSTEDEESHPLTGEGVAGRKGKQIERQSDER